MFCSKCGHEMAEGVRFCAECGQPVGEKVVPAETNEVGKEETYLVEIRRRSQFTGGGVRMTFAIDDGSAQKYPVGGRDKYPLKAGKHRLKVSCRVGGKEACCFTEFVVSENMELEVYLDSHGWPMAQKTANLPLLKMDAE